MIMVKKPSTNVFEHVVLDFDGTISLIREGWQSIMISYFTEELLSTPIGNQEDPMNLETMARDFITLHTGKQTIYQCIALADEIKKLDGIPLDPQYYKNEYHHRLLLKIENRLNGLRDGTLEREPFTVPGTFELLDLLRKHGVQMYLASGTDEHYVLDEAHLLGVDRYFGDRIYGAQKDYKKFSKKFIIDRIINDNKLAGPELLGFGDGYVEIENIVGAGGYAVGVASNEHERHGFDTFKQERLTRAGAHMIIPDYRNIEELESALFSI